MKFFILTAIRYALFFCAILVTSMSYSQHSITDNDVNTQDAIHNDSSILWDQAVHKGYNHDVTSFISDSLSDINKNQPQSSHTITNDTGKISTELSMSLTPIYDTNRLNTSHYPTLLNDKEALMWGHNGADLNAIAPSVTVNLSAGITPALTTNVRFTALQRVWKVVETGGNIPKVKVLLNEAALSHMTALGHYYMFISNTDVFDSTADSKIMRSDGNGNLEVAFDFDGTQYITFGYASEVEQKRSIYFDGTDDYIDMDNRLNLNPSHFTVSAWVKRDATHSGIASIVSKRDAAFTQGYDLRILDDNRIEIIWKNGSDQSLISNTRLPDEEWHHIAAVYTGSIISIFIDGVFDNSDSKSSPVTTNASFYIAAAGKNATSQHFRGHIDEVRVWNVALPQSQLRFIMNQEIANNSGQVMGEILPTSLTKNDIDVIPWSALAGYYPMSTYTFTNTDDASGNGIHGALININTVDRQTAPLPYLSTQNGDWDTKTTWTNGNKQYIPGSASLVDSNITVDWNIVRTSHQVTMDNSSIPNKKEDHRTLLGLYIDANELTLKGNTTANEGNGLTVSHYMSLTGKIDLEGESQLIQDLDSDLDVAPSGTLERDQQGTADTYTYKYWSAPVGKTDMAKNEYRYAVQDIMYDGTHPINFITSGYNGAATSPIGIADYWIWKYANRPNNTYSAWQHVRRTGSINAGEGFTMKGPGTGSILTDQNYVYLGKPNNGDINLTIQAGNDFLVGNPYASTIDANQFIIDNGPEVDDATGLKRPPTISGTLYFWKHWGGGTHYLEDYQGGYATYNFSGSVAAASYGTNNPDLATGGTPTKLPGRYIAVGQGFFVVGKSTGTIKFNNGQRVFQKEGSSASVFLRNGDTSASQTNYDSEAADRRMKFRIGFKSINTIHRQLLLTIDENTSPDVDWAYDAKKNESQMDDMYWMINGDPYIIQASNEAESTTLYPLGIRTNSDGLNTITIDALENVPDNLNIYVHDRVLNLYHDLRQSDYEVFLNPGQYHDRFEITFEATNASLGVADETLNNIDIRYSNTIEKIVLINPKLLDIKSIEVFNILGQSIYTIKNISESGYSEYDVKNLSTGTFIIKLLTGSGSVVTKKVLVY